MRCDEDVSVVSDPERIIHDSGRVAATSGAMTPVGNPPIGSQSVEAAPEKGDTTVTEAERDDTLDDFTYGSSRETLISRTRQSQSHSSAWTRNGVLNQFVSISGVEKATIISF